MSSTNGLQSDYRLRDMKLAWIHCVWAGISVVAFVAGTLLQPNVPVRNSPPSASDRGSEGTAVQSRISDNSVTDPVLDLREGNGGNSPRAEMKGRFFDALYQPNRMDRRQKVIALLEEVTSENWQGMIDSFGMQTIHTGRRHDEEWDLALRRAGEVAGSVAVESFLNGKGVANDLHAGVCLEAWAARQPKDAAAWFRSREDDPKTSLMAVAMVRGLAQSDPVAALTFVESMPRENRLSFAEELANGVVQHGGIESAMKYVEQAAQSGDLNYAQAFFAQVGEKVFFANWVGQSPEAACRWVEGQLQQPYMTPGVVRHAAGDYAIKNPEEALTWLEKSVAESAPAFLDAGIGGVMTRWNDNTKVAAWLEAHPDHPLRDMVTRHFAWRLGPLDSAAAEQWISTIKSEEIRGEALREFQERRR